MMKTNFLYRLFKHSKIAFCILVIFLFAYSVFFYKKMDAVFFPYNSMFSIDFTKQYSASAYALKINGMPVKISHNLYWKKDFLEETLINYAAYCKNNHNLFMHAYLQARFTDTTQRNCWLNRLTPEKTAMSAWLHWFAAFAGYPVPPNATVELMQFDFIFEKDKVVLTDSISIYKTISL